MGKTKPIGVRFDKELIEKLKSEGKANSPQKALNFLTDYYLSEPEPHTFEKEQKMLNNKSSGKPITIKLDTSGMSQTGVAPPMPIRGEKEDAFDFAQRKNEWKKLYGK